MARESQAEPGRLGELGARGPQTGRPVDETPLGRIKAFLAYRPETAALFSMVIVFVVFAFVAEDFVTQASMFSIITLSSERGIVAVGVTLLLIAGHFDLSVGSVLGLTAILVAQLMLDLPSWQAVPLALLIAFGIGLLQGFTIVKLGIPSFILTLGGLLLWRGVGFVISEGLYIPVDRTDGLLKIFSHSRGTGLFVTCLWFLGVVVLGTLFLQRTRLGNWIFAIGGSYRAAKAQGVPADHVLILLFGLCALLAGLAGTVQMARFPIVSADRGRMLELEIIAAAAIGGTRIWGGYGSVVGAALGVLSVSMIQVGLARAGVPGEWFDGVVGLLIVFAVMVNRSVERRNLGERIE